MSNEAVISIHSGKASGVLHRACICLIRQGYEIRGNRVEEDADGIHRHITITLKGGMQPVPQSVIAELGRVKGCLSVEGAALDESRADPAQAPDRADALIEAVRALLVQVYGDATDHQLNRIVDATPPGKHPRLFIEQCRSLVGVAVGDAIAGKMFDSLHDRFS